MVWRSCKVCLISLYVLSRQYIILVLTSFFSCILSLVASYSPSICHVAKYLYSDPLASPLMVVTKVLPMATPMVLPLKHSSSPLHLLRIFTSFIFLENRGKFIDSIPLLLCVAEVMKIFRLAAIYFAGSLKERGPGMQGNFIPIPFQN